MGIAPIAGWWDDVLERIEALLAILAEAKDVVETCGGNGPLVGTDQSDVQQDLEDAEDIIDQILDSSQYPSLLPADAGSVDPSVDPTTLFEHADDCVTLAEDARDAVSVSHEGDATIGSKLKTIKSLLPGYRQEAGIPSTQ